MLRKQFVLSFVVVCSLLGWLGMNAQGTPGQIIFVRFHIKNKVISYVAKQVAVGEASDRQMLGDFRVVVYASDHQTVLEEYRIPDPRKGYGPENPEAGITWGPTLADDIDFDLLFPLQEGLRYIDIYDKADELQISADLSEALVPVKPSDFNQDRVVNLSDFAVLANCWLQQITYEFQHCDICDLDANGEIGWPDLAAFADDWLLYEPEW
jgi:hypothetical protein